MMKKLVAFCVCLCLLIGLLAGCGSTKSVSRFEAENEIFTYKKPDVEKTQLVVGISGNIDIIDVIDRFESANPDIQAIVLDITGGNDYSSPAQEWLANGDGPDILFGYGNFLSEATDQFEDLSAYPFVKHYTAESLLDNTYDGKLKFLPGASKIEGICYNVTLFEQYGWEIPQNTEAFIALCKQIEAGTNGEIDAWNPNAKYPVNFAGMLEALSYANIFSTADDRVWLSDFQNGKATFAGHMEPFYELIQRLVDEGILTEDYFNYSATTRLKEFLAGKIAMLNHDSGALITTAHIAEDGTQYQFGVFPYPSSASGDGNLIINYSFLCGAPKGEHTDKEQDAITRFLTFISSNEAQDIMVGDGLLVSNVGDYESATNLHDYEYFETAANAYYAGRTFTSKSFRLNGVGAEFFPLQVIREQALRMVKGELTAEAAIAEMDATVSGYFDGTLTDPDPVVIAAVPENMTILETSAYMADMFREVTGVDIALIPNNCTYRGNVMKIYAGDFTEYKLNVIKPRSYANDAALTMTTVTGADILELLNNVPGYSGTADAIYAFSGLKATVAPWAPVGEKYVSVTLADGTAIDENAEYTVAFWAGSVPDEYVIDTATTFEGTFEELLRAYMETDGEVTAPNDGRITLIWE